jgi:hypothetical protein
MNRAIFVLHGILLLSLGSGLNRASAQEDEVFLRRLILPKDKLPEGCTIPQLPKDFVKGKELANPCIISDADTLRKLPDRRRLVDIVKLKAMLFAVYKEKNEIGVSAWRLDSSETAEEFLDTMKKRFSNERRVRLWQTGPHVIWPWRDPGVSNESFSVFEMFLDKAVKERDKK